MWWSWGPWGAEDWRLWVWLPLVWLHKWCLCLLGRMLSPRGLQREVCPCRAPPVWSHTLAYALELWWSWGPWRAEDCCLWVWLPLCLSLLRLGCQLLLRGLQRLPTCSFDDALRLFPASLELAIWAAEVAYLPRTCWVDFDSGWSGWLQVDCEPWRTKNVFLF